MGGPGMLFEDIFQKSVWRIYQFCIIFTQVFQIVRFSWFMYIECWNINVMNMLQRCYTIQQNKSLCIYRISESSLQRKKHLEHHELYICKPFSYFDWKQRHIFPCKCFLLLRYCNTHRAFCLNRNFNRKCHQEVTARLMSNTQNFKNPSENSKKLSYFKDPFIFNCTANST